MSKALPLDLSERVSAAVSEGATSGSFLDVEGQLARSMLWWRR